MTKKLTRRQFLKLLTVAAGGAVFAAIRWDTALKTFAQSTGANDVYLPLVMAPEAPTSTPTPTPTNTPTPTPTATNSPTPPPAPGTFIDGPGGNVNTGKDVLMSSYWPTRNGGQHPNFQLEGGPGTIQHVLIQFDLSSLPANYTCTSAQLYLYNSDQDGGINSGKVYSIASTNYPWIEGIGNIDIARQGEPCWNAREADGNGGVQTPWAGSEGCSTPGVDYEQTPIGTWSFDSGLPVGAEIVIELDSNRVQGWFGNPNTNYGIILITDDNVRSTHVGSAENENINYRPKLVVHYE